MSQLASNLQSFFKPREVLLVGVVLLFILGGLGLFSLIQMPTLVAANAQAIGADQMKRISTAYVATSSAHNATTATVQAGTTATVEARTTAAAMVAEGTATAIASGNPYPPHNGTLALDDTLRNNSASNWVTGSDKSGFCRFTGGAFHVRSNPDHFVYPCSAFNTDFSNFVFQVQMTFISGNGGGGIMFRKDEQSHNYTFIIRSDGSYGFFKFTSDQAVQPSLFGTNSAIKTGLKRTNLITVIARGKVLDLYINNRRIDGMSDGTFSRGIISVNAETMTGPSEVAFNNAKVWTL